ncbi:MAG: valine--tRNA ligase [Chloroflexota bacterium]
MTELVDNSKEMDKAYNPQAAEKKWYTFWEEKGYFRPEIKKGEQPFTIIMPPPNVTGALHVGHALTTAIEDALIRWHRMRGEVTLYLPGSDHAGISGETVVEKLLLQTEGKTKNDLGREEFLNRVWEWMNRYRDVIDDQLRSLGASCDWTRKCFTMDTGPQKAVRKVFKTLFDEGLIYRAERIVNWCPGSLTVISDLEVDMLEEDGFLWHILYPVKDHAGRYVTVATTRPETMLGDTGVAVHPADERYKDLVGKMLLLPLMNREIPVVADDAVESEFGTGAVKVTPGHDPLDFEIGQRHNLPIINIMNPNATINEHGGAYAGLERFVARKQVVKDLEQAGLLVKTEPYRHNVPYSQRAGVPIEPLVKEQWWVKIQPLAQPALEAAQDGRIKFVPERFKKIYTDWLENIHDWPISRQLFWGHRIPIYFCRKCNQPSATAEETLDQCDHCGSTDLWQDPDVLDTWFSSGLWPFSTLGWPAQTEELDYFYPSAVMETGYDIIFFWVARMVIFGLHFRGEVPFHTVYLHGLVRDEKGEKMSKSKGNVVDPLETSAEFGSDALRFTLLTSSTPGNDSKLSRTKLTDSRNFANKIWNATRFITLSGTAQLEYQAPKLDVAAPLADRWIVSQYYTLVADVNRLLEGYQLGEAGRLIYDFLWGEFCDWYIETSKPRLNSQDSTEKLQVQATLTGVLEGALRLLHPFMPFVTEELWHYLPHQGESLIIAAWPQPDESQIDREALTQFEALREAIRGVRNAKVEAKVESKKVAAIVLVKPSLKVFFERETETLVRLAGIDPQKLTIVDTIETPPAQALALVTTAATIYLPLSGLLDLEAERARLGREIEEARRDVEKCEKTLSNPNFAQRAPAAVVAKERERQVTAQERLSKLEHRLKDLG